MDVLNKPLISIIDEAIKQINPNIEKIWCSSLDKSLLQWSAPTYQDFLHQVDMVIEYSKDSSLIPAQIYVDVNRNYCMVNLYTLSKYDEISLEDYGEILAKVNENVFIQIGEQEL